MPKNNRREMVPFITHSDADKNLNRHGMVPFITHPNAQQKPIDMKWCLLALIIMYDLPVCLITFTRWTLLVSLETGASPLE